MSSRTVYVGMGILCFADKNTTCALHACIYINKSAFTHPPAQGYTQRWTCLWKQFWVSAQGQIDKLTAEAGERTIELAIGVSSTPCATAPPFCSSLLGSAYKHKVDFRDFQASTFLPPNIIRPTHIKGSTCITRYNPLYI